MNEWTQPTFVEIDMSAEIGGYQGEDEPERDQPDQPPAFMTEETP